MGMEREREGKRDRWRKSERISERNGLCVCWSKRVRERERER